MVCRRSVVRERRPGQDLHPLGVLFPPEVGEEVVVSRDPGVADVAPPSVGQAMFGGEEVLVEEEGGQVGQVAWLTRIRGGGHGP